MGPVEVRCGFVLRDRSGDPINSSPKKRRLAVSLIGDTSGPLLKWSGSRVGSWAISGSARDRNAFASSLAPMNITVNQNSTVRIGLLQATN